MEFAQQFGGSYISMEGALWRTLWRLLFLPGQLTLEFLAGRRRRYVLPLRLYLTISVLTLLTLRVLGTLQMETDAPRLAPDMVRIDAGDAKNAELFSMGDMRAGLKDGKFYCENLPEDLCKRVGRRLNADPQAMAAELREVPGRLLGHFGSALFVLLPTFALWLKLVYWSSHLRYTEHMVFALHLHSFWFLMILVALLPWGWTSTAAGVAMLLYPLIALQRVYRKRWWSTTLRAFMLQMLYLTTVAFAMTGVVIATLLT